MNSNRLPIREEFRHEELDDLVDRRFPDLVCPFCKTILRVMTLREPGSGDIVLSFWCTNNDCAWRLIEEEYKSKLEELS